jgi:hypothetical protein
VSFWWDFVEELLLRLIKLSTKLSFYLAVRLLNLLLEFRTVAKNLVILDYFVRAFDKQWLMGFYLNGQDFNQSSLILNSKPPFELGNTCAVTSIL